LAETTDMDTLFSATRAALNIAEPEIANQWFARIPRDLDRASECRRLVLQAAILKDQGQANALPEILDCLTKATELMAEVTVKEQSEFAELRREIAFDSLPTALFLSREPAQSAASRLAPILPQFWPQDKAHLLATLAEREMKEPANTANWAQVAEWVTAAATLVEGGTDDRTIAYCIYQQAQYLRKRPQARYDDAWRMYQKSRAAGERSGEPRREGLALLRLVELERSLPDLRQDASVWPARRLVEVDRVVARLRQAQIDALTMRVLGRLQAVAATLESSADARHVRLTESARAFSAGVLSARIDNRMFAEVCLQVLNDDLAPSGDFLMAQRFLSSFRFDIEKRLGVTINVEKPEAGRDAILQWLESPLERTPHGEHAKQQWDELIRERTDPFASSW